MSGSDKLRLRIDFPGKRSSDCLSGPSPTMTSRGFESSCAQARSSESIRFRPEVCQQKECMVYGPRSWSRRDRPLWRRGNRVIGNENFLAWKTQRGILLRTAPTVGDHGIELPEKGCPSFFKISTDGRRSQSPANDRPVSFMHPADGRRSGKIARVGLHDQGIRVPLFQPVDEAALVAQIEGTAE